MTIEDFSNEFDVLLNSYAHTALFGQDASAIDLTTDEYEKSWFLTKAQEEVALNLYNGKGIYGEAFEETEELRRYLSILIREAKLEPIEVPTEDTFDGTFDESFHIGETLYYGMSTESEFFKLPDNIWFITYESVNVSNGKCKDTILEVFPTRQDEYHRIKQNPFRGANGRRALRFDLSENIIEIVCKYDITSYYVRYLRKLKPIILINLADGLTINGENRTSECELPDILHQRILERAVALAYQSKAHTTQQSK